MPYINKHLQKELEKAHPNSSGELNYILTMTILNYLETKGLSYSTLNDISGAMTECLAEFRRRIIVPYENKKIIDHGDVYPAEFTKS